MLPETTQRCGKLYKVGDKMPPRGLGHRTIDKFEEAALLAANGHQKSDSGDGSLAFQPLAP